MNKVVHFIFIGLNSINLLAQTFEKLPCEENVTSKGNVPTTLVFKNETNQGLRYYWVDFQGNNKYFGDIPARAVAEQATHVGQYWLVMDINDNCIGKFVSRAGGKVIIPIQRDKSDSPLVYNTSAQPSEQLLYHAAAPQVIGFFQNDQLYMAWKDFGSETIKVSSYSRNGNKFSKRWHKDVPKGIDILGGFVGDGTNLYCLTAIEEDVSKDLSILDYRTGVLNLVKMNEDGEAIWVKDLNNEQCMKTPVFSPTKSGTAELAFGNGKLVLIHAGNTLPDKNKIRHQKSSYLVLDAENGDTEKNYNGNTSWRHSFDQRILFDGKDFIMIDLGDAGWYMPAGGIAVHKIVVDEDQITLPANAEGIFAYARQSETAGSQNFSFISMGDIAVGEAGYVVLFSSEKTNRNQSRSGWQQPVVEPRNVGIVHLVSDFDKVNDGYSKSQYGNKVTAGNTWVNFINAGIELINITENVVDTQTKNNKAQVGGATFSRPDKTNLKFKQASVAWLTNFKAGQNFTSAERPKLIKLMDGQYLAIWEEWLITLKANERPTAEYQSTQAMLVDEYGNVTKTQRPITARLNPNGADKLFLMDGKAAWITGENNQWRLNTLDRNLKLEVIDLDL